MIKLLIVDDSPVAREFLKHIFSSDPEIMVAGVAQNGQEAVELTASLRPDVITMDLHMPILDGLGATRKIMEACATPIVIVSGNPNVKEAEFTFQLLEAGALAVSMRPPAIGDPEFESAARKLIETVKSMSEIRVVSRLSRGSSAPAAAPVQEKPGVTSPRGKTSTDGRSEDGASRNIRVVAIGASIGGPQALQRIFSALPKDLPVPILIVQHIDAGFAVGFAKWLETVTGFPVHLAVNRESPLPGHVYVPPPSVHMGLESGLRLIVSNQPPEENLRPAVSFLFRSVAQSMGPHAVGVLLTGMGRDGSKELKSMKDAGAITIAQDKASSVVFGMPCEAIRLNAATFILSPEGVATYLTNLLKQPQ